MKYNTTITKNQSLVEMLGSTCVENISVKWAVSHFSDNKPAGTLRIHFSGENQSHFKSYCSDFGMSEIILPLVSYCRFGSTPVIPKSMWKYIRVLDLHSIGIDEDAPLFPITEGDYTRVFIDYKAWKKKYFVTLYKVLKPKNDRGIRGSVYCLSYQTARKLAKEYDSDIRKMSISKDEYRRIYKGDMIIA